MGGDFQEGRSLAGLIAEVLAQFRSGLWEALQWPAFSWLRPRLPVLVDIPDGSRRIVTGRRIREARRGWRTLRHRAVLLPDEQVLLRVLDLPDLPRERLLKAVELDVSSNSPFAPADTVWGWSIDHREERSVHVTVALTSRAHAEAALSGASRGQAFAPEVWARIQPPLVISGFGERRRMAAERRRAGILLVSALVALLLGVLLAATPTLQLHLQARDATRQIGALQAQAAELVAQRDSLSRARMQFEAIEAALQTQPDLLGALEMLAAALPDSVYLDRLVMQGSRVTIDGRGPNISALLDRLGAHDQIQGLRATSAITRIGEDDVFSVEFVFLSEGTAEPGAH